MEIETHRHILQKGTWDQITSRARKGPSRVIFQKCALHERSLCALKFKDRAHEDTFHQERCAGKAAWDLAKHIHRLKSTDKAMLHTTIEASVNPTPTAKRPDEREFAVDSGASNAYDEQKRIELR